MATRSQVREVVAQFLYAYGSGNDKISKFIDEILQEHKIKNTQSAFAKTLFFGVLENLEALDLRIKHRIENWDFERVGDMERAILRLGAYEILFSEIDKAVVINEALELAKNFCSEHSAKFVNGILDGIAKNAEIPLEKIQESLQESQQKQEQNPLRQKPPQRNTRVKKPINNKTARTAKTPVKTHRKKPQKKG